MFNKEEIILRFLEDPLKLITYICSGELPKSDEIRTLICDLGDPRLAYYYAAKIDKKPTDETRKAVCKDPEEAYYYARFIDCRKTEETWNAVQKNPNFIARYNLRIKQGVISDIF